MKHKVKVTVLDRKLYPELQQQYLADPESGACPCYNVGDEFIFLRDEGKEDYWHLGLKTLVKTNGDPDTVAGGPKMPFCSEAWDAISRYIYTGLQGGLNELIMSKARGASYVDRFQSNKRSEDSRNE